MNIYTEFKELRRIFPKGKFFRNKYNRWEHICIIGYEILADKWFAKGKVIKESNNEVIHWLDLKQKNKWLRI